MEKISRSPYQKELVRQPNNISKLPQPIWRQAEAVPVGPYQIAPQANTGNAWIVNTATGQVRLCLAPATKNLAAECLSWTQ